VSGLLLAYSYSCTSLPLADTAGSNSAGPLRDELDDLYFFYQEKLALLSTVRHTRFINSDIWMFISIRPVPVMKAGLITRGGDLEEKSTGEEASDE
jgi:hypothetical protein